MKGTAKIKNLGTVDLSGISIGDGQIEVHIPIKDVADQLDKVFDECVADYMKKHDNVKSGEELLFDVRVVFSCGGFARKDKTEFNLFIIVWQKADEETGMDTAEFYEEIPVVFADDDLGKIKKIIWDALGAALFNL